MVSRRRPISPRALLAPAFAILVTFTAVASAQDSSVDRAKEQYELGYTALQQGDYATALDHYQRSYDLTPRPRTLFNIAVAEEHLGRLEDALRDYAKFVDVAEERDEEFAAQARNKLVLLAKKLPRSAAVTDRTPPPVPDEAPPPPPETPRRAARPSPAGSLRVHSNRGGATVSVDGLIVGTTAPAADGDGDGAVLSRSLAAGDHDVIVERSGAHSWHQHLHVSPREVVTVNVTFRDSHTTRSKILTWGLAGVGTISIAAGSTLGVLALRDVTSDTPSDHSRGKTRATVTDILLVGGAAALYGAWRLGDRPATTATVERANSPAEVTP